MRKPARLVGRKGFVALALFLVASVASAVSFTTYRLGSFYKVAESTDRAVQDAAKAVVFFGNATGFLISPEGHILTNHHVYETFGNQGTVYLEWTDSGYRTRLPIVLVTRNAQYDMALYKTSVTGLPYVKLRTRATQVGEDCFIVGHPESRTLEVSYGRILAKDLVIAGRPSVEYSAQTWWGSSGSPVCDRQGGVIALHWGWDANGQSNGRLTGVPFELMAPAIPEIRQIAQRYGVGATAPTTSTGGAGLTSTSGGASLSGGSALSGGTTRPTATTTPTTTAPTVTTGAGAAPSGSLFDLALGATAQGALAKAGDLHLYRVRVQERGTLTVGLTGPSGANYNLHVWRWLGGDQGKTVGRSNNGGSTESVTVTDADPGLYYAIVTSAAGSGTYRVTASLAQPTTVTSNAADTTGFLRGDTDWQLFQFDAVGGTVSMGLVGATGTDFDLYVFRGQRIDANMVVAYSNGAASNEGVRFTASPGTYSILVRSERGAGRFALSIR